MKAAVLENLGAPLVVRDVYPEDMLDYGQVLVKVLASTICGAQIREITGAKGPDKYLPHLLGHEGCGKVIAIGPGVTNVNIDDHVVMHWRKGIGIESPFPRYHSATGYVGAGLVSTFTEWSIVSENRLTPIGKDIPPSVACLFGCAVTTALGLINNEAQLKIGQSIAIAGVGGVGLNIVQGAALVGGNPIIAIDVRLGKLGFAKVVGATHTINNTGMGSMIDGVKSIVGKRGVDVFVDCTGVPSVIEEGFSLVASGGKMVLVGQMPSDASILFTHANDFYSGKTLLDSQGGLTNPRVDIPRYADLYRTGRLQLDSLVTHTFPLIEINDAVAVVKSGQAGRVALEMS